ncbi:hypothetical protein HGA34_04830 [Candidatus Falkowbacteria bacterium]|nr:hypothetical protein [Candidatus Falkowbacteria bacterium]
MPFNSKDYRPFHGTDVHFSRSDQRKVKRIQGQAVILSTVCPDYPHEDGKYTFRGELGRGASLTAASHLRRVPDLISGLNGQEIATRWLILVADLPELTSQQKEFYLRVAASKDDYIGRCEASAKAIKEQIGSLGEVKTFSSWYTEQNIPYLEVQEEVAERILHEAKHNRAFSGKFDAFCAMRQNLAAKFRGRRLTAEESAQAAAHGMSLYVTHGSLLRKLFADHNLVVINHFTPNLQNFFLSRFVPGCGHLENAQKFPLGVIDDSWY